MPPLHSAGTFYEHLEPTTSEWNLSFPHQIRGPDPSMEQNRTDPSMELRGVRAWEM